MINKSIKTLWLLLLLSLPGFTQESELSVEKIMQGPKWFGHFPIEVKWDVHGEKIYFQYSPDKDDVDALYQIHIQKTGSIQKLEHSEAEKLIPESGDFNKNRTQKIYVRKGNLFLYDLKKRQEKKLLELPFPIKNPRFLHNENWIALELEHNIYQYNLADGGLKKVTDFVKGEEPKDPEKKTGEHDEWRKSENLALLEFLRDKEDKKAKSAALSNKNDQYTFYSGKKDILNLSLSPNGKYVVFNLLSRETNTSTIVPDYVKESGYTDNLTARPKVGSKPNHLEMAIYSVEKDTVLIMETDKLTGIRDLPDFVKDYPDRKWEEKDRTVNAIGPVFSENGEKAIAVIRSHDNKDRWIVLIQLETGDLKVLDRQRDEAWIAGPGIGSHYSTGTLGWLPDDRHIYFQSEESGYSHLYLLNIDDGNKTALTQGEYEVFDPVLSNDKKHWYFTSSAVHPGERHFYKMPAMGGEAVQLTKIAGNNEVILSPDEKYFAIRYSYSNQPWELYLQKNDSRSTAQQLTDGQSKAFQSYPWRDPELIKFEARDGSSVPARIYLPEKEKSNGAAVVFVHGAGYLQNVHKWWSQYFREYMFHNLLADLGYTVLDIDYRGSAGYGRDWRTGIYRYMGDKDLSDQIDGMDYLVDKHGINPDRIGIYGGSYGGFITLMAMFKYPDKVKSGAALRSVTDWAHYNHGYTSNILNLPADDPIAYKRSSPIYHAEGLKGHLLIAHGMVDINVHFQDVVRLTQRLIELKKENWEMAVYPVEDHGFTEPSSWTDEYKRILKLFNDTLIQ